MRSMYSFDLHPNLSSEMVTCAEAVWAARMQGMPRARALMVNEASRLFQVPSSMDLSRIIWRYGFCYTSQIRMQPLRVCHGPERMVPLDDAVEPH